MLLAFAWHGDCLGSEPAAGKPLRLFCFSVAYLSNKYILNRIRRSSSMVCNGVLGDRGKKSELSQILSQKAKGWKAGERWRKLISNKLLEPFHLLNVSC